MKTLSKLDCKRLFSDDLQIIQPNEIIDSNESFITIPACHFKQKTKVSKLILFQPFQVFKNCSFYASCIYSQAKIKMHIFEQDNEKIIELNECCLIGLKIGE